MKRVSAVLLGLAAFAGFTAPAQALIAPNPAFPGNAVMIYDPASGNVKIDAVGLQINGFNFQDVVDDATLVFAGPASPTFPTGGLSTTNTDVKVSWATTSSPFTGVFDLGNIAIPGLNEATMIAQLSGVAGQPSETYYTRQATGGRSNFNLVVVPEPATAALLGVAGLGLVARRRRVR